MKKGLLTLTYVMFCVSVLLSSSLLVFAVLSAIIVQMVPPVVIFAVLTCPFVLLSLHYAKCIKIINCKNNCEAIKLKKLAKINSGLSAVFIVVAISALLVALYPLVFYGSQILLDDASLFFFVYFVCICAVSTLYTVNFLLINKEFGKITNGCEFLGNNQVLLGEEMKLTALQHYTFEGKGELANIVDDCITYSVVRKILAYQCTDIFTNDKSIVICYTNEPYPIWVWCKKPFDKQDVATIVHTLKTHYLEKGQYKFNISEDLLTELIKVDEVFASLTVKMELLSYELTEINEIDRKCDGQMQLATMEQAGQLALLYKDACFEMEGFDFSLEHCTQKVTELIQNGDLHVWKNDSGEIVATASKGVDGKCAKIAFVYTLPSQRRKGYAINLVHSLSKILMEDSLTPILYTDGQYAASNACYQKIGYKQVGKLVEVENKN